VNPEPKPALPTIECVVAFGKWYGMPVDENMDLATEIAWANWQAAWNAALAQPADKLTQMAHKIADESCLDLINSESIRVDHVTLQLDSGDLAGSELLSEAVSYLEARGLVTRVESSNEVLLIVETDE